MNPKDIGEVLQRYDKLLRMLHDPAVIGPELANVKIRLKTITDQYPGMEATWRKWVAAQAAAHPEQAAKVQAGADRIVRRVNERASAFVQNFTARLDAEMDQAIDDAVDGLFNTVFPKKPTKEKPMPRRKNPEPEPVEIEPDFGTKDWTEEDVEEYLEEYLDVLDLKTKSSKDEELGDILTAKFSIPAGLLDAIAGDPDASQAFVCALLGIDDDEDEDDEDEDDDD